MNEIELKIARFLATQPKDGLVSLVESEDLINFWVELKTHNEVVACCFASRFLGLDNPIAEWRNGKPEKLYHNFIWTNVDVYQSLWQLVQMSFDYVQEEFRNLSPKSREIISKRLQPPDTAFKLFLQIVGTELTNQFQMAKSYHRCSVPDYLKVWELIRKSAWATLEKKEFKTLNQLTRQHPSNFWLEFTWFVCQKKAKNDQLIANKVKDYRNSVSRLADAHLTLIKNARRGGRIPLKLQSYEWRDGKRYLANRHGGSYNA